MEKVYRRIAIWLCVCLVIGLMPPSTTRSSAASGISIRLILANKKMTKKTYTLENGLNRQLSVDADNTFGKTTITYKSGKKKVASISKKGFIRSKNAGTTKITVKVTCKSGRRTKTKTSWVKIKVVDPEDDPWPTYSAEASSYQPYETPSYWPYVTSTPIPSMAPIGSSLQAVLLVNGNNNTRQFPMTILDNASGRMLYNSLPKTLYLTDQNRNTKVGLDSELIYTMDEYKPTTLVAGDFMLYGTNRYELTYSMHQTGYAYTRLGWIADPTGLASALGTGPVSVTIIPSTLPTVPPSVTPYWWTPTPVPTPRPSGWTPGPSATITPYWWSPTPTPSVTPRPSGWTPSPTVSATPTPKPVYTGPRFKIMTDGNFAYYVQVDQNSKAAMALYNSLPQEGAGNNFVVVMNPFNEFAYHGMLSTSLTQEGDVVMNQWPAGSLVLYGGNRLFVYLKATANYGEKATILGRIDTTVHDSTTFLSTMFGGSDLKVYLYKA